MNVSYREQSYINAICMMSNIIGGDHWNYEGAHLSCASRDDSYLETQIWSICRTSNVDQNRIPSYHPSKNDTWTWSIDGPKSVMEIDSIDDWKIRWNQGNVNWR